MAGAMRSAERERGDPLYPLYSPPQSPPPPTENPVSDRLGMSYTLLLNALGLVASLLAWVMGSGGSFFWIALVFGCSLYWHRLLCKREGQVRTLRSELGDYLSSSLGLHLLALAIAGAGDWKLGVLGIGLTIALPLLVPTHLGSFLYGEVWDEENEAAEEYLLLIEEHVASRGSVPPRSGFVALPLAAYDLELSPVALGAFLLARTDGGLFILSHSLFPLGRSTPELEPLPSSLQARNRNALDLLDVVFVRAEDLARNFRGVSKKTLKSWAEEGLLYLPDAELLEDLPTKLATRWSLLEPPAGEPLGAEARELYEELLPALEDGSARWLERRCEQRLAPTAQEPREGTPAEGASSFEQELEAVQTNWDQLTGRPDPAPAEEPEEGGGVSYRDLIEVLRMTGPPFAGGIDWSADAEEHFPKLITAVAYAGFTLRHLHSWPAAEEGSPEGSPENVARYHHRTLAMGHRIWEWQEEEGREAGCAFLYLTVESVLKVYMVSGAGFEALYQRALADAALEDGLFRSTNGRFSFACDLLKITEDFRADAMQSLKERFGTPGTNYVDGNAADGDLTAYMEVLAGAQLAILQFLLKAHINAADLEPARVEGILEVLLPVPRAEYIQHWCGSAGFE